MDMPPTATWRDARAENEQTSPLDRTAGPSSSSSSSSSSCRQSFLVCPSHADTQLINQHDTYGVMHFAEQEKRSNCNGRSRKQGERQQSSGRS